jgi:hypothetical protein
MATLRVWLFNSFVSATMLSKLRLSTFLTTYTKNHPHVDDSSGKALENALIQLKEAKKQTKKRKDAERQCLYLFWLQI